MRTRFAASSGFRPVRPGIPLLSHVLAGVPAVAGMARRIVSDCIMPDSDDDLMMRAGRKCHTKGEIRVGSGGIERIAVFSRVLPLRLCLTKNISH